jgi:hypothetical protein
MALMNVEHQPALGVQMSLIRNFASKMMSVRSV